MNQVAIERNYEFGEVAYPDGGQYLNPPHQGVQLAMVLKGEIQITTEHWEFSYGEGQAVCHRNDIARKAIYRKGRVTQSVWCTTPLSYQLFDSLWQKTDMPRIIETTPLLSILFSEGLQLLADQSFATIGLSNALAETAFREYFRILHLQDQRKSIPYAVLRAKDHLDRFYKEPCNLEELGEITSLNPRYLLKLFKQHLGTTPSRYLWKLRGDHAMRLLKHSGLSIKEISYNSGFQNPYHFSRYISRHYGSSPSSFRKK